MQHKTTTWSKSFWSWVHNSKPENNWEQTALAGGIQMSFGQVHGTRPLISKKSENKTACKESRNRFLGFTCSISVTFPRPRRDADQGKSMGESTNKWSDTFGGKGPKGGMMKKYEEWNHKQVWNLWFPLLSFSLTDGGLFFRGVANISWSIARPKTYPLPHQKQ